MERPARIWRIRPVDAGVVDGLAREMGIPRLLACVLVQRGLSDPDQARKFLNPSLDDLHPPEMLPDFDLAIGEILNARDQKKTIYVHGDYDADGVTSAAIFTKFLKKIGCIVIPHVPHRMKEGYGIHIDAVQWAKDQGTDLFLTCDCGISAHEQIKAVNEAGMRAVVTDHHELKETLPEAVAVVNPHRPDSRYPFDMLSGAGVALKLCAGLAHEVDRSLDPAEARRFFYRNYMDLAALGTIADIMPLIDENRIIAKFGLEGLQRAKRPGIQALLEVSERHGLSRKLTTGDVGYHLGPRINAVGRIGDAADALQMLITTDLDEGRMIARDLDRLNRERRAEQERMVEEAMAMIEAQGIPDQGVLVVAREGWHPGIIGLVASKLVEKFYRPAFVVALGADGSGKGSARSISGYHLANALNAGMDHHCGGGGHEMAAGFSITSDTLDSFRQVMSERAQRELSPEDFLPKLEIDAEVLDGEVDDALIEAMGALEPFGTANAQPLFAARGVKLTATKFGQNPEHVFPTFGKVSCVSWNLGPAFQNFPVGTSLDLAFRPEFNEFRGERSVRWKLEDAVCSDEG
jgi:single-stranded-DNA-specific exonuclease